MKIRKMRVENFRALKDKELRFDDDLGRIRPVTVLAGPNGCGKTSVLFAIVQALRGVMGYRTDDVAEPNELEIHRRGAVAGLSPRPVSVDIELDLEFDEAELRAIPQILEDSRVGQSVAATAPS